ncbi:MAG: hypothetical protein KF718_33170 [Polyangiaceae bacterium]|nr:hypothetical protein [Polyangiaceae bacterium]
MAKGVQHPELTAYVRFAVIGDEVGPQEGAKLIGFRWTDVKGATRARAYVAGLRSGKGVGLEKAQMIADAVTSGSVDVLLARASEWARKNPDKVRLVQRPGSVNRLAQAIDLLVEDRNLKPAVLERLARESGLASEDHSTLGYVRALTEQLAAPPTARPRNVDVDQTPAVQGGRGRQRAGSLPT